MDDTINHKEIIKQGLDTLAYSYSPYSGLKVSSAIVSTTGKAYFGCNVENASYPLTICAEMAAVCHMITAGEKSITRAYIFSDSERFILPCGACRQKLKEFSSQNIKIHLVNVKGQIRTHDLAALLPHAFDFEKA